MQLEILCTSKDGKQIFFNPETSHAATHFRDASDLRKLVVKILQQKNITGDELGFDVDMGRLVGHTDVVETNDDDERLYAKRDNRDEYVPFVKNRSPQPCRFVSISLLPLGNDYELQSAWIGSFNSPPFPQEAGATRASIDFWNKHAFVWGSQGIREATTTSLRPW